MGFPLVYPTGVTIYDPDKAYNGYTLMSIRGVGAALMDMNGNMLRIWKDLQGMPNKLLKGGYVMGHLGIRDAAYGYQDYTDLVQVDWDGNVVWKFNKLEYIEDPGNEASWMLREHHDYQREGNPVGYYVPGMECQASEGKTTILCHQTIYNAEISDKRLLDDCIIEVDWAGNILWKWAASNHLDELGLSDAALNAIYHNPNLMEKEDGSLGDWLHINTMSLVGSNKWYDAGDERFHPENIIWDSREANIIAIIRKTDGKIVWQLGPDFATSKAWKKIGQIIGPHHAHIIPKGLPGEGNLLVFDNGSWAGYGDPSSVSKDGIKTEHSDHSRVLEINPITFEVLWQCTAKELGYDCGGIDNFRFYSPLTSAAQRLPNGNTVITEGTGFRIFEVTKENEVVWEYCYPFSHLAEKTVYRTYRYPYDYIPQLTKPIEVPIEMIDIKQFRVPGSKVEKLNNRVIVEGAEGYLDEQLEKCLW